MFKLLLVFGILISGIECGYYFVTAPNVIRFDNDETVVVSVFDLINAEVKVWLQHGDKRISEKNVVVANEKIPKHTTVRVAENDILNTFVAEEKPRAIQLFSEWNGQTQSRAIVLSYNTGYIFIQTEKPIYTPIQKVNIRILALDESLRKVNGWQVVIDIVDPSNRTLGRNEIENSTSGFFEHQIKLPPYPEFGVWTVRAFYKGHIETEACSHFELQEYVLPTYGVEIDVDCPYISKDTASIHVTVRAKYVYGKPVNGNARLKLNLKDKTGLSEHIIDMTNQTLDDKGYKEGSVTEFSIKVADILNSPLLKDKVFPDGSRLEVVATVFESATGKEEATSHEGTVFTTNPYIFRFTKSKLHFRPGFPYFLKVEMLNINGQPAAGENIEVKMYKDGDFNYLITRTTDKNGHAESIFYTSWNTNTIEFSVATSNKRQESEKFRVEAYAGKNQIQVEHVITDNNMMVMQAYSNIRGDGYTGMTFMVVTRGKIVYTKFKEAANLVSEQIMEDIQELVSPDARLIVFYVDKGSHELVADSSKFDVEKKCRGEGLNLATDKLEMKPGSINKLTVTGSPYMWVGLNVMDKALLLLNNKNVLRKNKMFKALQSHDIGCGVGGGKTSAEVFKKSGLTVLTNAKVDANDLERNTEGCGKERRKRDDGSYYSDSNIRFPEQGAEFVDGLIYKTDDTTDLDKCVDCFTQARDLTRDDRSELKRIKKRSLDDESDYEMDMAKLEDAGVRPRSRPDFRESWLFQLVQLDKNGQASELLTFPDSITEWIIQGIGITSDNGMCIAENISVKAFKDFFIQLDLPYKAVRLEHFDVKATIFSYGTPVDDNKPVNIYIEGVEHLCYGSVPGYQSPKLSIELPPNSAQTVSFPMIPLRNGIFPVQVSAVLIHFGIPEMDAMEKSLYVVNEGIEKNISIHVCLNPTNQDDDCKNDERVLFDVTEGVYKINLTLPGDSIPQTRSATAYFKEYTAKLMTHVVSTIIEGVDSLFRSSAGSGEGTMKRLAPTVYAMSYIIQTEQVTDNIEKKGNQWIRNGIDRLLSIYRHSDGSYSAWKSRRSSTWLTAFVAKVFCQAYKTVDNAKDETYVKVTIDWLRYHVKSDGSFVDNMPVIHRDMIGQIDERDPTLSAFVLITLKECEKRSYGLQDTIVNTSKFLASVPESTLKNNPFLLAICTYALALVDSPKKYRFKTLLHNIEKRHGNHMYWGSPGGKPANAQSVETTAYALLAMIEFKDSKNSAAIVRWLTSQRYASGLFRTTQDTVVGLQALTQYSIATTSAALDLKVTLLADDLYREDYSVTKKKLAFRQVGRKLPVEHKNSELTVKVSGFGKSILIVDLYYNRPESEEESCPFDICNVQVEGIADKNIFKKRKCDVCGRCELDTENPINDVDFDKFNASAEANSKNGSNSQASGGIRETQTNTCIRFSVSSKTKEYGKSLVHFGLETGVEIVKTDLEKLMEENPNIAKYEMPSNGQGFVKFYLNKITSQQINFTFRLKDEGDTYSRQPSSIVVYDYYNSARQCTKYYDIGPNRRHNVDIGCDKEKKDCKCLRNTIIL